MLFAGPVWQFHGAVIAIFGVVWLAERVVNPMSTRAWGRGAEGEEATARYLADLEPGGYLVLHDRRIPGTRANIDHLVIGPTGVFVVDSKNLRGDLHERNGELWVGRRRRAKLVESAAWQAEIVERALAPALSGAPVQSILAVHTAHFPVLRHRLEFDGVVVVPAKDVVSLIGGQAPILGADALARLSALAELRLKPMVGLPSD